MTEIQLKQFATIIILTLTLNCSGQFQFDKTKISNKTAQLVAKIEKVDELMGSAVYNAGIRPEQYDNFTELQKRATIGELAELTNHPNGVVRCYAFWALSYDTSTNLLPIVIRHLNDITLVKTQFGCLGSREKVGDFFIDIVTPQYVDLNSKKLTNFEYAYLDSILVYVPNTLYAKEKAIIRAKPTENLYTKVRDLVIQEKNQSALVTLAKFQREQDIQLILKNKMKAERYDRLFFTYRAISEFPHPSFLPLLRKSLYDALDDDHWSTEWRELYKAIASYKNDTALQLLKIPFTQVKHQNIRQYHIDFVFAAVQDFYSLIYDDLLWELWANEKKITTKVYNILYQKNQERAFHLTKKTIENANDFNYLNSAIYIEDEEVPVNLLDVMLDTIVVRDRPFAIELINKNLREINVLQFTTFADKALNLRDTSFVTSLFVRLEKEDNPHTYLKATETLISFNDKDINKQIVEVSKRNANLRTGWGGQNFADLLKKNNIK